ncbi:hypothetical protein [Paenibacillus sp. 7516]|uniref:hypothetical protein n=1 Tax=Paenibacillus sp. 7516 TaxID=2022549 RepID=UPI001140F8BD|nr:hypothetical protein [Paenibacillus sp. 7516]
MNGLVFFPPKIRLKPHGSHPIHRPRYGEKGVRLYYRINRKRTHTESSYAYVQTGQEAGLFDAVIRVRH